MSDKTWTVVHGYSGFDYTKDCIESFSKYPNIIWSSWKDTPRDVIELLERKNIPYVLSDYPIDSPSHFSYQVAGFRNGLKLAKEFGAKYVYKTRNDLDIVNFDKLIEYLENKIENGGKKLNNICWDWLSLGFCDFCFFGEINELDFYWDISLEWCQKYGGLSERMVFAQYCERRGYFYDWKYKTAKKYIDTYINDLDLLGVVINRFKWTQESPLNIHYANRCIYL